MDVGQQSKQNRAPSPRTAKRSYTYDALMRLNNIENCLIDMQRSRDDVISNIGQILEREKSKLVLQREKSSNLLRLAKYHATIADKNNALEEDRRRVTSLRQNNRSRHAAIVEAKEDCQIKYKRFEEKKKISEHRSKSLYTTSKLYDRQRELVADLLTIFPIEPTNTETFSFKILGVLLPNSVFTGCDDEQVATALGFTSHLIDVLAYYLGVPLRFPIIPMSSRSTIHDPITASLGDSRHTEYVTCRVPFKRLLNWIVMSIVQFKGFMHTNNQLGALFPLYAKGVDRYRFEYAVFLLNKNIEQLMNLQGLNIMDLRNTLPNLKYLILSLVSTSQNQKSVSHLQPNIPHSINNATVSTSNNRNHPSKEEEENKH